MGLRTRLILAGAVLGILAATVLAEPAHAARNVSGGAQVVAGDLMDKAAGDYRLGLGFNLTGLLELNRTFDLRADVGFRWYEGKSSLIGEDGAVPDLGGRAGDRIDGLRVIPTALSLVYRFEDWSRGRYWIPYAAAGFGLYDLRASFAGEDGEIGYNTLFRPGWSARGGVQFHRTSGLFMTVETAVHVVDLPGAWTPTYEIAFGIGALLPGR